MGYPIAYRQGAERHLGPRLSRTEAVPARPLPIPSGPEPVIPRSPSPVRPWRPSQPPGNENRPNPRRSTIPRIKLGRFNPLKPRLPNPWRELIGIIPIETPFPTAQPNPTPGNGYTLACGINPPPINYSDGTFYARIGTASSCGLAGQALVDYPSFAAAAASNPARVSMAAWRSSIDRFFIQAVWLRPGSGWPLPYPMTVPIFVPEPVITPLPVIYPGINPEVLPIGRPVPRTRPLPIRPGRRVRIVPNPNNPNPRGYRIPPVQPRPRGRPNPETPTNPRPWAPPPPQPPRHPPGPGTKERKFTSEQLSGWLKWLAEWYDDILFGTDMIEAWYEALPAHLRRKDASIAEMLKAIYTHFDKIDIERLIENVLLAVIWEKVGGNLERFRSEIAKRLRLWKMSIRTY